MAIQNLREIDLTNVSDTQKIDILKKVNTDLKSSLDDVISILAKFSEAISIKFDLKALLELVCGILKEIIKYKSIAVTIYDEKRETFNYMALRDVDAATDVKIKNLIKEGLAQWAVTQKRSIVMPDMESNIESTFIIVPLISQMETIGVVFMYCNKSAESFMQQDLEFLNILGAQSAIAVKNTFLYQEMGAKNRDLDNLKNYLNDVINHMVTGLIVMDLEGVIKTFNHISEGLLFIKSTAVVGKKYESVLPRSISETITQAMNFVRTNNVRNISHMPEYEVDYDEPGKVIPLRMSFNCLKDNTSNVIGVIFMIQDLTESREIKRLKEIDKIKSELVANVSHELRTPLTSIKAYAETLLDIAGTEDVDTQKEFLGIICQESERLTNLISNLLDLSRLESGDFKLDRSAVDLSEIIKKSAMLLKELASRTSVSILIELPQDVSKFLGDASKIEQVVINLISNAIKYNKPEGGKVTVSLREFPDKFEITIKDTGIGVPQESVDKIFDKFYRVDSSLTYQVSGTGLGLAIVKHIIDLHGGQINVESQVNIGSKFSITLPK
ncbi:MAG TPA: ATP-binding protein [Candidatus Wallbacteria bacterium]|nr:ATP-binding protein [Candidatus Wallbacteria bacterium]